MKGRQRKGKNTLNLTTWKIHFKKYSRNDNVGKTFATYMTI